jgi:excisionase family DNA binding protein
LAAVDRYRVVENIKPLKTLNIAPTLITMAEAGQRLRLGKTMVQQLVLRGELRSIKIGAARRIPVTALEDFVQARMTDSLCDPD